MCSNVAAFFSKKNIELEGLDYIKDFLLLWGYVESRYFEANLNEKALTSFVEREEEDHRKKVDFLAENLKNQFSYFKNRYSEGASFNLDALFNGRDRISRYIIGVALSGPSPSNPDIVYSCMHIVRRLRNNLFHGTKAASLLREQESNFNAACQILLAFCAVFPESSVGG